MIRMKAHLMEKITEFAALHYISEEQVYNNKSWYQLAVKYAKLGLTRKQYTEQLQEQFISIIAEAAKLTTKGVHNRINRDSALKAAVEIAFNVVYSTKGETTIDGKRKVTIQELAHRVVNDGVYAG
jgi:hypothetical protein